MIVLIALCRILHVDRIKYQYVFCVYVVSVLYGGGREEAIIERRHDTVPVLRRSDVLL